MVVSVFIVGCMFQLMSSSTVFGGILTNAIKCGENLKVVLHNEKKIEEFLKTFKGTWKANVCKNLPELVSNQSCCRPEILKDIKTAVPSSDYNKLHKICKDKVMVYILTGAASPTK
ncbi:MAG: hypothetical protein HOL16_03405 [Alphaproteobacteria bacterium]|nr:hypothetical protein [Alphaproteobacteria bacterium]